MNVGGKPYRTIWLNGDGWSVDIIDQTLLPHRFETVTLRNLSDAAHAIRSMQVRGAPLIGVTAAYGLCLALREDASDAGIDRACETLRNQPKDKLAGIAYRRAAEMADDDVAICKAIGGHGLRIIQALAAKKPAGHPVNILTHCNAGWLATVDWGTATAPIYAAHGQGIPLHVWVDETRPRNQGASLTAWELNGHGVPHTVIADNVGGHLMQHGQVDMCIVGTDRTTASGDVANKIGTYLKALAARDNGVPFYVGLPSPTIDWRIADGIREIPIEQRSGEELSQVTGRMSSGEIATVTITPEGSPVANYAFDVTPAALVTGLITERGVAKASREGLAALFPERAGRAG
jgi:methylthioribose-1-phosphate isomerase